MLGLLGRLKGVKTTTTSILLRGGPPLIVVDGIKMTLVTEVDPAALQMEAVNILGGLDIDNISQVDVIRSLAKIEAYGLDGKYGVIEIFTKRGWIPPKQKYHTAQTIPLGYSLPVEFYSPKYETKKAIESTTPDLRSTIYWKPDGATKPDGKTILDFYSADASTSYSIVLEGVSEEGRLIYYYGKSAILIE